MNKAAKRYTVQFSLAMVVYGFTVIGSGLLLNRMTESIWRIPLALLPVMPVGFGLWAFIRFLGRMDELQQRIQLHAIAWATSITIMLTFAYGFLERVGFPPVSVMWVFPMLVSLWGVGLALATRKYT